MARMVLVLLAMACGGKDGGGDSGAVDTTTTPTGSGDTDTDADADTDSDADTDTDTDADADMDTDTDSDADADTDTDTDTTGAVASLGPEEVVDPVGAGQGRLALAPAADGGWWATWDDNDVAVEATKLGGTPFLVEDMSFAGVGTPRLTDADGSAAVIYRYGPVTRIRVLDAVGVEVDVLVGANGDTQPLSGWSTPRIARRADGTYAAVWWTGTEPIGNDANYWFRRYTAELEPMGGAIVVGGSEGAGSPANLIPTDEGWLVAWSERTGFADDAAGEVLVRRLEPDGTPIAGPQRVDTGALDRPAERPVLAVVPDGFVVGWRAQTFDQVGVGVRARHLDALAEPLTEPYALGGPTANRLNVAAVGSVVLFQWEEDEDVWWQLGRADGTPLTDAARAADDPTGRQGLGAVASAPGSWPARFRIGWEEGPAGAAVLTSRDLTWGP